jgi:hypothetical protein
MMRLCEEKAHSRFREAVLGAVRAQIERNPRASSTSAAPVRDDIARLPCLATGTPQAAITNETAVEILSVP